MIELKFYNRTDASEQVSTPFDICLIIGDDHSFLESFMKQNQEKNIMIYSTVDEFKDLEDKIISLWEKYPSLALSTKTFPFSFSHFELARTIAVATDVADNDINTYLNSFVTSTDKNMKTCCCLKKSVKYKKDSA